MPDIKTREIVKDVKVIDKAAVAGERMRSAFVRTKDQAENLMDDGQASPSEYAEDKIRYAVEDTTREVGHEAKNAAKKTVEKGREAHRRLRPAAAGVLRGGKGKPLPLYEERRYLRADLPV